MALFLYPLAIQGAAATRGYGFVTLTNQVWALLAGQGNFQLESTELWPWVTASPCNVSSEECGEILIILMEEVGYAFLLTFH